MRFLEALFPEMPPVRIITLFRIAPVFVERSEADKPGCAALPQGRHMPAPKVRADFDLLNNIATRFSGESDNITQMQSSITQAMSALEGGDWVGPGATAFYAEMRELVLPAVQRLIAALGEAGTTATKIGRTVKQAETDAARQLRSTGGSGAPKGHGQSSPGGSFADSMMSDLTGEPAGPSKGGIESSDDWVQPVL